MISRRAAITGFAACAATPVLAQAPLKPREEEALALRAHRKGLVYGAALASRHLQDAVFGEIFAEECGMLVPEWEAKWRTLQPQPGRFDFTAVDRLIDFARRRNLLARGHTLVWHQAMPDWLAEAAVPALAARTLVEHIGPVVARYRGRMHSWDVVNEALEPRDDRADGLRITPWLKAMGPRYLDAAFRAARAADPDAMLVLNEYGLDYARPEDERRRRALVQLLAALRGRGVPVDAVGIQAHLVAGGPLFDARLFRAFLAELADLGLKILITELDVTDRHLPADIGPRDRQAADHVARYVETALDERAVIAVLTWGLADRFSWLNQSEGRRRTDGLKSRGLPLDDDLNRKPIWAALARAFDAAPPR